MYVYGLFMTTAPTSASQTTSPDPQQDRPAPSVDATTRTGRLLSLVRKLIDYGKQLAATLQQRSVTTNLADITRNFGTSDIARILASITRGLLLAAALEAKVASRPIRQPAAPDETAPTPSRRQPRSASPEDRTAAEVDPRIANLPTPEDIADQLRRRPAGAVIADICRLLGIVPADPLWREICHVVMENGGSFLKLYNEATDRIFTKLREMAAAEKRGERPQYQPATVAAATGPP
jgi:hypothetical protein